MPNWCNNLMTITHPDPAMMEKAAAAWNSDKFLSTMIPCPQELRDTMSGSMGASEDIHRQYAKEMHEFQMELNKKYFGYRDWYDWCIANWGTKWDIGYDSATDNAATIEGNSFTVRFDSAWSPPIGAYEKLEQMGYTIIAYYFESGCDFCGKYAHGVDECYRASERTFPDEIDEVMSISGMDWNE